MFFFSFLFPFQTIKKPNVFAGKPKVDELIKNVQCGYDVRRKDYVSRIQDVNSSVTL